MALWTAGTARGLITTVWIPFRMMTTHDIKPDSAVAGWLMPVVPPMASASDGALLIPHLPEGQHRLGMLMACYAMFGISLFATLFIVPQVWQRLVQHKTGAARSRVDHRRDPYHIWQLPQVPLRAHAHTAIRGTGATADTWRNVRHELDRMHLVTLAPSADQVAQRSATTPGQQVVLRALDLPEPPKFFDFTIPDSD